MSLRTSLVGGAAVSALLLLTAAPGQARTLQQLERQIQQVQRSYQGQIQNLQQQIEDLKEQQRQQAAQAEVVRQQAEKAAMEAAKQHHGPHVVEKGGHEFGLASEDGQDAIYFTGRIHFDTGAYFGYDRKSTTDPRALSDGVFLRRARIGFVGKFAGDWDYGLIFDGGGGTVGVENAYVVYNGLRDHHQAPISFVLGAIDVPWTMDEATSSNDFMFMEHSSAQNIATSFGGGDNRTAFGITANNNRYWLGAFLTGPKLGAATTYSSGAAACTISGPTYSTDYCNGPQMAFLARGTYQIIQNDQGSLHIGVNFGDEFRPRDGSNNATIGLADIPELKIDTTKFLNTGSIPASSGMVIGAEAAGAYENAFVQGEYYHYSIDQLSSGAPTLDFNGGYAQASYSFGGRRHYKAGAGAYSGVHPDHPLSFSGSGWGALELAFRYSVVDLNAGSSSVTCSATSYLVGRVCGGNQQTYAVGLNYYPNDNMRFMLDFEHVDVSAPTGGTGRAVSFNDIGLRTQVNW